MITVKEMENLDRLYLNMCKNDGDLLLKDLSPEEVGTVAHSGRTN
jgi:hypothetical protein